MCFATPIVGMAQVTSIGQFSGSATEGYETQAANFYTSFSILGGLGTANQLGGSGQGLNVTTGWSFFFFVGPHSGNQMMGGAACNYSFNFATPAQQFGGFFATNADIAGGVAVFYDSTGTQIGGPEVLSAPQGQWQWNGWEYAGGISRVDIIGNNQFGGFIMSDDLQYNPVPEPATLVVVGLGLAAVTRRRHKRT